MISEYINNIDKNNIVVCDPIKNSIIQYSSFYKLIYTNEIITMNGIYILFDLNNVKICIDKITFDISSNYDIIDSNLEVISSKEKLSFIKVKFS